MSNITLILGYTNQNYLNKYVLFVVGQKDLFGSKNAVNNYTSNNPYGEIIRPSFVLTSFISAPLKLGRVKYQITVSISRTFA